VSAAQAKSESFGASLAIQSRVIGALLMRELITRYGRHNIGLLWIFVEPMMFTVGVLIMWTLLHSHSLRLPLIPFTITGYSSVLLWRNTIGRCGNALEPNRTLLHHRNVRVLDFYIARLVLELVGVTVSFTILASLMIFIGFMKLPYDMFEVTAAWLLMAWFAFGAGLLIGAGCAASETVDRVWHVLSYLFMPVSGAFFMVEWLPSHIQKAALWVPTVDGTELFREGFFGPLVRAHYDVPYLIIVDLALTVLGLFAVQVVSTKVEGT
jgi:capsular polysaccharide transport system permease protein